MLLFAKREEAGSIFIDERENSAVQIAVKNLAQDIEKVCGIQPAILH